MTGTDRSMFSALGDRAQFFTVSHGSVTSGVE
jgi:DNA replication and repair protein RecF